MHITPDSVIVCWHITATMMYSWLVTAVLVIGSWAMTRRLRQEPPIPTWQKGLETIIEVVRTQIAAVVGENADRYVPFIGTLFLYISMSSLLSAVPLMHPPTASLSTTAALAMAVFVAVPFFSISQLGVRGWLHHYVEVSPLMLPFEVLGEITRTLSLAVRLFGNMMSGSLAGAILLVVAPFFFPVLMQLLELLIGQVQAYIFAVLATVYIAASARVRREKGAVSHG